MIDKNKEVAELDVFSYLDDVVQTHGILFMKLVFLRYLTYKRGENKEIYPLSSLPEEDEIEGDE
jgi:hypothetical protein